MKATQALTAFVLIVVSGAASAEDMKPGLWKISLESRVPAAPDWTPEPFVATQCLTEEDARHPDRLMAGMAGQGVTGCDFANQDYSAGRLRFDVKCAGALGLAGQGEVTYSATRLDGNMDVSFADETQEGQKTVMQNQLHAEYLGQCNSAGGSMPSLPSAKGLPALPPTMSLPGMPPAPPAE